MGRTLVVGVGNTIMRDDGVGVAVVEELKKGKAAGDVAVAEAGTSLLDVLASEGSCERLVIVDAVGAGGEPGSIYRFGREDVEAATGVMYSLHDVGVAESLALAELAGAKFGTVRFVGVEPFEIGPGEGITDAMRARLPALVAAVREEVRELDASNEGARRAETAGDFQR